MNLQIFKLVCLYHQFLFVHKVLQVNLCSSLHHDNFLQLATVHFWDLPLLSLVGKPDYLTQPLLSISSLILTIRCNLLLLFNRRWLRSLREIKEVVIQQRILDIICEFENRLSISGATFINKILNFKSLSCRITNFFSTKSVNAS